MDQKGFFRNASEERLLLYVLGAAVLISAVVLLYPKAGEQEEVKSTMATLPAPTPAVTQKTPTVSIPKEEKTEIPEVKIVEQPQAEEAALPLYFIWPVSGLLERDFDENSLSYDTTMADWRSHNGWDISAALGGHVLSAANGTVSAIYEDALYGTTVEIDHGQGLVSVYSNLASEPTVSLGQSVLVGDVIGAVGESALCEVGEGFHLHFAMKLDGVNANPANWLPER